MLPVLPDDGTGRTSITNKAGGEVLRRTHRPYGDKIDDSTSYVESRGWIDQRQDGETGLTYLHARYYDPTTGVFLSPDPIGPKGGLNSFSYSAGNPANLADRSGLDPNLNCVTITDGEHAGQTHCGDGTTVTIRDTPWWIEDFWGGLMNLYPIVGGFENNAFARLLEKRETQAANKAARDEAAATAQKDQPGTPPPTTTPPPPPNKPPKPPKPFPNADGAAKDTLKKAIPLTSKLNQEICFSVCKDGSVYIPVVSQRLGDSGNCTHFEKCPSGTGLVAYGHTHPPGGWPGYSGEDLPGSGIASYLGLSTGEMYSWVPGAASPTLMEGAPATPYPTPSVWPWP